MARVDLYGVEPQQVRIDLDLDALQTPRDRCRRGAPHHQRRQPGRGRRRRSAATCSATTCGPSPVSRSCDEIATCGRRGRPARRATWRVVELREPRLDYGRHLDRTFAIGIDVYKEPTANTVETVDRLMERIEEISEDPQLEGIKVAGLGERRRGDPELACRACATPASSAASWPSACSTSSCAGSDHADRRRGHPVLAARDLRRDVRPRLAVQRAHPARPDARRGHAGGQRGGGHREHPPLRGHGNGAGRRRGSGARQVALAVIASTATTIIVWSWLFVAEPRHDDRSTWARWRSPSASRSPARC